MQCKDFKIEFDTMFEFEWTNSNVSYLFTEQEGE